MEKIDVSMRDGVSLACYLFRLERPAARLFYLHGSTYNSRRYFNFARACHSAGYEVVLIDWRGHGESEGKPGHCKYPGQLEDDLKDVIDFFSPSGDVPLVVGGHSAGAIVTLKYLTKYGQQKIAGCFIIAPALANFPEISRSQTGSSKISQLIRYWRVQDSMAPRSGSSSFSSQYAPKVSRVLFWSARLVKFLRSLKVLRFPRIGVTSQYDKRVLDYSYNVMMSSSLNNYVDAFSTIRVPTILICGDQDEVISTDSLEVVFNWHLSPLLDKSLYFVTKANHLSVINASSRVIVDWLTRRWGDACENCA